MVLKAIFVVSTIISFLTLAFLTAATVSNDGDFSRNEISSWFGGSFSGTAAGGNGAPNKGGLGASTA